MGSSEWTIAVGQQEQRFVRLTVTERGMALKIEMINDVPAHIGSLKRDPAHPYQSSHSRWSRVPVTGRRVWWSRVSAKERFGSRFSTPMIGRVPLRVNIPPVDSNSTRTLAAAIAHGKEPRLETTHSRGNFAGRHRIGRMPTAAGWRSTPTWLGADCRRPAESTARKIRASHGPSRSRADTNQDRPDRIRRHPTYRALDAIGTRNFIVHGYDRMDYDVIWDTIAEHFPALVVALEQALPYDEPMSHWRWTWGVSKSPSDLQGR